MSDLVVDTNSYVTDAEALLILADLINVPPDFVVPASTELRRPYLIVAFDQLNNYINQPDLIADSDYKDEIKKAQVVQSLYSYKQVNDDFEKRRSLIKQGVKSAGIVKEAYSGSGGGAEISPDLFNILPIEIVVNGAKGQPLHIR